jgi:putative NADH-flavin reductase
MKVRAELHQELRQRILSLADVTERQNAGIHEDAFFVGGKMFMHIHPESFRGHSIIESRSGTGSCGRQSTPAPVGARSGIRHSDSARRRGFGASDGSDSDVTRLFFQQTESYAKATPIRTRLSMRKPIMKLFVIGATGRTGQEIVQQALARSHQVTAFVRSPGSVTSKNERLSVLKGNATDENQLFEAMQNHDAVISTLGPREVFKPGSLLNDSALATTRAMQRSGVKRLVVLSAAAHFPGIPNRIASFILRNYMRDSLAMEKIVQANGLDWTIARPPRLTQEDFLHYRSREGAAPRMGFTLSRKAVAAFMLDAIEQKKHFQKIVGIAK